MAADAMIMQRVTDLRLFVDTIIGAVYEDIKPLRWALPRLWPAGLSSG